MTDASAACCSRKIGVWSVSGVPYAWEVRPHGKTRHATAAIADGFCPAVKTMYVPGTNRAGKWQRRRNPKLRQYKKKNKEWQLVVEDRKGGDGLSPLKDKRSRAKINWKLRDTRDPMHNSALKSR